MKVIESRFCLCCASVPIIGRKDSRRYQIGNGLLELRLDLLD